MHIISSCFFQSTPLKQTVAYTGCILSIMGVALSIIGMTASASGSLGAIVQFGSPAHACLASFALSSLVFSLVWLLLLHRKQVPASFTNASLEQKISDSPKPISDSPKPISPIDQRDFGIVEKKSLGAGLSRDEWSAVFSFLPRQDLMSCKRVCKIWYDILSANTYFDQFYAFCFLKEKVNSGVADLVVKTKPQLPNWLPKVLKSRPPFLNGKMIGETHSIVCVDFPTSMDHVCVSHENSRFDYESASLLRGEPFWILVMNELYSESLNKSYSEQEEILKKITSIKFPYRLPHVHEILVFNVSRRYGRPKAGNKIDYTFCDVTNLKDQDSDLENGEKKFTFPFNYFNFTGRIVTTTDCLERTGIAPVLSLSELEKQWGG